MSFVSNLRASFMALTVSVFTVGGAMAQDAPAGETSVVLSGSLEMPVAFDPIDVSIPEIPQTLSEFTAESVALGVRQHAQSSFIPPAGSALPWYERFTIASAGPEILWNQSEGFEMTAGERWGLTLSYSQNERQVQNFDLEDFSAEAFFELTDRVRLGGEVRFTSPEAEIFGEPTEERTPEVRFESAFKF
jgi:hypothetical protein